MNFDIERIRFYRTYCDECGWESEASTEEELGLDIEEHMWWAHEGLGYTIDN